MSWTVLKYYIIYIIVIRFWLFMLIHFFFLPIINSNAQFCIQKGRMQFIDRGSITADMIVVSFSMTMGVLLNWFEQASSIPQILKRDNIN